MKKILSALVVLLALGAAGAMVYLFQKTARGGAANSAAVDCLPAGTLLLLSLPDLNQTAANWTTTDLYKIWSEPDVQAFLAKPLSRLSDYPQLTGLFPQVTKLEPRNLFVALTALEDKSSRPHLIAGFQFKGSTADVDAVLATPKEDLHQHFPAGKADLINYQGHPIETFDTGESNVLASLYLGDWYLVANDVALLEATVDRLEHRAPAAGQPSLGKEADFQAVLSKLPSGPATLIFARAQPFVSRLYDLAMASGQAVDARQRAEAEKVRALGATTRIENGKFRDTIYTLAPGHQSPPDALQMSALPLASMDTLFFAAGVFGLPAYLDPSTDSPSAAPGTPGVGMLQQWTTLLQGYGFKPGDLRAAFGNEAALQIGWPANSPRPQLLASLDVHDRAAADKIVDKLTSVPPADGTWKHIPADGQMFHAFSSSGFSMISPTLMLSDKHLVLGLGLAEVQAAAQREKTPVPNFTGTDAYKAAMAAVEKPNVAFAYLDSRAFFERAYGMIKPYVMVGAAFVAPQAGDYVDLGKLPEASSISKHLSPAVFSETSDSQGILLESVGSFTFGQAAAIVTGVGGAAAFPMLQKQFATTLDAKPSPAQTGKNE